jgi:PAS domain S-box-containing protein
MTAHAEPGSFPNSPHPGRRGAESLRQLEQQFESVIHSVTDYAIFLLDPEGTVMTWNAGAERIKGYRAEEIVGRHFTLFYTDESIARRWPQAELEVAAREGRMEDEGWRVRKDGSTFWARVVITALRNPLGELTGFLKITGDLTDRRLAEAALRDSEERFRLMVEEVRDYAIFRLDPEGRVASWNAGAERIKGYAASEIIGQHFSRFYPAEQVERGWPEHELREASLHGRFVDEGWRVRKDGGLFWASVVITAMRNPHGELIGFSKVTRDLTERKLAEEELRQAHAGLELRVKERTAELERTNFALEREIERGRVLLEERERLEAQLRQRVDELAASDRHKNEFLAMLAHELRNPLAPIRNSLELLRVDTLDRAARDAVQGTIRRQVEHLVRLVDDLLDVSRIVESKIELRRERIEFASVVQRAVETARPQVDAHGHELAIELPAAPVYVQGDLIRLSQVFANLLNNAAKYSDHPGRIVISARVEGDTLVASVADSGIGMPDDLLHRVFDLFVQGSGSLERSGGGLGIGLTLVQRIVEMHGGRVSASSPGPGQGSELVVRLPVAEPPEPSVEPTYEPAAGVGGGLRVLVVDDNVDAAESTAALLAIRGPEARAVHDGLSVQQVVTEFQPTVVLVDSGLPGKNGFEVARVLRALAGSPVRLLVAVTGYGQEQDRARAREAGFDLHLVKPVDPRRLHELLASLEP